MSFYNRTKTKGGHNYLFELMECPLTDVKEIIATSELIKYLSHIDFDLEINSSQFDFIEHYMRLHIPPLRDNAMDALYQSLAYRLKPSNDYYLIQSGIQQLIDLFNQLQGKLYLLKEADLPQGLKNVFQPIITFIDNEDFVPFTKKGTRISARNINRLDWNFRKKYKSELHDFIKTIYALDAYTSVSKVAKLKHLSFAEYSDSDTPILSITNLFHPLLSKAIPYTIQLGASNNLCFLTGPNMAGKSTFLKSLGLSIYISHLGFPIPASQMKTSIYNGLITTINLSDNMNKGYSHFYSEVKRIKDVALLLKEKNNLFVIFDELFRGTNVKDAYDASLLIIENFAKINKSIFCISTHITEVAEKLEKLNNIEFKYFNSELIDHKPVYDYQLKDGISHERLGMHIIKNENIIDILKSVDDN